MTTVMSLDSQIKTVYPNLTKSEKKVADYILKHLDIIGNQTLAQMSKKAHVGEATIMRFIYKLDYENIAQFKIAVVRECIMKKDNEENESAESYAKRVYRLMKDSLNANKEEDIDKVARLIDSSSHVYFFGNGTSGFAAAAAAYRFFRAGVSCEGITDVHMMIMKSALLKENELVVAVSQSGDNLDIIQAVKLAEKNKCPIVTITGRKLSTLSKYGTINLFHAPTNFNDRSYYGGMLGIIIQEYLLEIIFNAYSQIHPEEIDEMQQRTTVSTNLQHEALNASGKE